MSIFFTSISSILYLVAGFVIAFSRASLHPVKGTPYRESFHMVVIMLYSLSLGGGIIALTQTWIVGSAYYKIWVSKSVSRGNVLYLDFSA